MEKTTIEHFNNYLKLFILDISRLFPEYEENLNMYYSELLQNDLCNDDKYVKRFIKKTVDFKDLIKSRNDSLFNNEINIVKTVDFSDL